MSELFARFSHLVSHLSGRPATFVIAVLLVVGWAVTGPLFGFSETWQLVINTATTIITFLMVFVLQNSQNRDGAALQAKLDELIFAMREADNRFVEAEKLTDSELQSLHRSLVARSHIAGEELDRRDRSPEKRADQSSA